MTPLQFVASLVHSLAWPIAAGTIAVVFRSELRSLVSQPLRRLRAGPLEMEFARIRSEVEADVLVPAPVDPHEPNRLRSPTIGTLQRVIPDSPAAAVLAAHAEVETQLRNLLASHDDSLATERMTASRLVREALERKLITPEAARAVEGITVLRNLAAHGQANEITPERANEYLALADASLFALQQRPRPE